MSRTDAPRARSSAATSRGTATARRIEASAVALVLQHGYDATTVDMICADAGISQRTFFNHFATKDAAVIGTDVPRLDESRVRAFIAATGPHLLADAAELIALPGLDGTMDPQLMRLRMKAITSSAELMQRQLERFASIEAELAEVIEYRLARLSTPDESAAEVREQSRLTAHLLAGILRYSADALMSGDSASVPAIVAQTRARLTALLPKLAGR
jgi:AcrR family transcriptional regulator